MQKVQIYSASSYLPSHSVSSIDLFEEIKSDQQYGIPSNWMSDDMGVVERRMAPINTKPSELATRAAEKALLESGLEPSEIDMIIFCGIERDHIEPATAHTISNNLGINAKKTYDVSNACYGFIDGLENACNNIILNKVDTALIVTAELFSRPVQKLIDQMKSGIGIDNAKKNIGFLSLGDAAGAVVLGRSKNNISGFQIFNTGTLSDEVKRCHYNVDSDIFCGQMEMGKLSAYMIRAQKHIKDDTLDQLGWSEVDCLLSHQIGKAPFDRLSQLIDKASHIKTYDYLGNIASATFPVNFEKMLKSDKFKQGSRIMGMFGGSGLVYGQVGYRL